MAPVEASEAPESVDAPLGSARGLSQTLHASRTRHPVGESREGLESLCVHSAERRQSCQDPRPTDQNSQHETRSTFPQIRGTQVVRKVVKRKGIYPLPGFEFPVFGRTPQAHPGPSPDCPGAARGVPTQTAPERPDGSSVVVYQRSVSFLLRKRAVRSKKTNDHRSTSRPAGRGNPCTSIFCREPGVSGTTSRVLGPLPRTGPGTEKTQQELIDPRTGKVCIRLNPTFLSHPPCPFKSLHSGQGTATLQGSSTQTGREVREDGPGGAREVTRTPEERLWVGRGPSKHVFKVAPLGSSSHVTSGSRCRGRGPSKHVYRGPLGSSSHVGG